MGSSMDIFESWPSIESDLRRGCSCGCAPPPVVEEWALAVRTSNGQVIVYGTPDRTTGVMVDAIRAMDAAVV